MSRGYFVLEAILYEATLSEAILYEATLSEATLYKIRLICRIDRKNPTTVG